MKVLYILDHYLSYHIDVFLALSKELEQYDIKTYIISKKDKDGENFYIIKQPGISELDKLIKLVEKEEIDIIHAFSFGYSGILAKYLADKTKKKLFYTFIRNPFTNNKLINNLIYKYLEEFLIKNSTFILPRKIAFPFKPRYILPIGINLKDYNKDANNDLIIAFDLYNYRFINTGSNVDILINQALTFSNVAPEIYIKIYSNQLRKNKLNKNIEILKLSKDYQAGIYYHGYTDQFIDLFLLKNLARGGKAIINSNSPLAESFDEINLFKDSKDIVNKILDLRNIDQNYSKILDDYDIKKLAPLYKYAYSNT